MALNYNYTVDGLLAYDKGITAYAENIFHDCHVWFVPPTRTIQYVFRKRLGQIDPTDKKDFIFVQRVGYPEYNVDRRTWDKNQENWYYEDENTKEEMRVIPSLFPVDLTYQIDMYIEYANTAKINSYLMRTYGEISWGDYFSIEVTFEGSEVYAGLKHILVKFQGVSEGQTHEVNEEAFRTKLRFVESLLVEAWIPRGDGEIIKTVKNVEMEDEASY